MKLKEKVDFLITELEKIYPKLNIPLTHKDPYTLLIAVLLSAQSTDKKVNEITPILFKKADNPYDMIKLSINQIREIIKPVGLSPAKSKGIWGLSKILIEKYQGEVPKNLEHLEELPAVGHKTASVVVSQAFGIPAFPVDTHIHRLMYRWGLSNGKNVTQTEKDAKRIFPKNKWNSLHLRIIYYGREYSPARGWDINNDIITKTIGRKSIINKLIE
ncbi:MAG: endonuclease III [Bacteroidota bacterium]|nr:endonuclease III [Bacteroidota bacterium]